MVFFSSLQHTSLHSTLGQFVFPISKANRSGAARCWKPASLADSRGLSHCVGATFEPERGDFRSLAVLAHESQKRKVRRAEKERSGCGIVVSCGHQRKIKITDRKDLNWLSLDIKKIR